MGVDAATGISSEATGAFSGGMRSVYDRYNSLMDGYSPAAAVYSSPSSTPTLVGKGQTHGI